MSRIERALEEAIKKRKQAEVPESKSPRLDSVVRDQAGRLENLRSDIRPTEKPAVSPAGFPGGVPEIDLSRCSPYLQAVLAENSAYAESYRKVILNLIQAAAPSTGHTVMVTSAMSGEGKSMTALHLAALLAQGLDHTVLLVDADLRRPAIHEALGIDVSRGLSDYLSGEADLAGLLVKTGLGKLVLLPAGRAVENPADLLSSSRMRDLIHDLKNRYRDRFVLFDTGPLLMVSEPETLAKWMDVVLFVVEEGRTPQKAVREGYELIRTCKNVQVVLNNAAEYVFVHKGGGYHGYGYGYGRRQEG